MTIKNKYLVFVLPVVVGSAVAQAEMAALDDVALSDVSGKGGVYLTGEFAINKDGGPLWNDGTRPYYYYDGSGNLQESDNSDPNGFRAPDQCDNGVCGMRFAIKLNENSEGWYVIDDLSGGFSFEGLTLRTEELDVVKDYDNVTMVNGVATPANYDFAANGESVPEVVKIGLPGNVRFNDFKFKFAVANNGEFGVTPRDENGNPIIDQTTGLPIETFRQTEIFGVQMNGNITIDGNLLLFPVE